MVTAAAPTVEELEFDRTQEFVAQQQYRQQAGFTTEAETTVMIVAGILRLVQKVGKDNLFPYQLEVAERIIESVVTGDRAEITVLQARQCLDKDTVVFRRDGSAVRISEHEDAWCTGVKPVRRYKVRGGAEIVATDNHPVWTPNGWTPAGDLRPGDKVSVLNRWERWGSGDPYARTVLRSRHRIPVQVTVDPSAEFARFLGYFTTDGSFRPGQSPKFTNCCLQYLEEMDRLSDKLFGIEAKWYRKGNGYDLLFTSTRSSFDNPLTAAMHALDWDHEFPRDVFRWGREEVREFVRTAWAGDGTVRVKGSDPEVFLACGNDEVYARYWQALLNKAGIAGTVKRERMAKGTGTFHRFALTTGEQNIRRFLDFVGDVPAKEAGCDAVRRLFGNRVRAGKGSCATGGRVERRTVEVGPDGEEFAWATVRTIEYLGEREVWDVCYEGKGWFVAQGAKVHNSGKTEAIACTIVALMILMPRLATAFPERFDHMADGFMIGVFAPVEDQAKTMWDRIRERFTSDVTREVLEDVEIQDQLKNDGPRTMILSRCRSLCRVQTAHPKANIESKSYHLAVVDEAQDADDKKVRKCVAEGTPVWTPEGPVPVERVVRDRLDVLTYDQPWDLREPAPGRPSVPRGRDTGELVVATPSEWHSNGVQPVWRVRMASGRYVDATSNHRWVVRERRGNGLPREVTTESMVPGMMVPVPLTAGWGGERGTRDQGYFAGQMLGDGCTSDGRLYWCGFADEAMAEMVRIAGRYGDSWRTYKINESGLHEGSFVGGGLLRWMTAEGLVGHKGAAKRLANVGRYSEQFRRGLVSGMLDSDGSVGTSDGSRRVEFASISEILVRQLQDVLLSLGIRSCVFTRNQPVGGYATDNLLWVLTVKAADDVRRLRATVVLHAGDKDRRLTELADRPVRGRRSPETARRAFGAKTLGWDRVVSVDYAGERETYCLTVDPSHTVVWNGVVGLNSIHPMLAFYGGTIVKSGSASTNKGDFFSTINRNWNRQLKRGSKRYHFQYDWKHCARYNRRYAEFIEEEKNRYGEDSDEFKLSYSCRWLLERGMFTTQEQVDALGDPTMPLVKSWHESRLVAGLDLGRKQDATVLTVLWVDWDHPDPDTGYYDHRILNWLELRGDQWEEQYGQIVRFLMDFSVVILGVDGQGGGDVAADRLTRLLPHIQVEVVGSNVGDQAPRWSHLMALMSRGLVSWPARSDAKRTKVWQRFEAQMVALEKEYRGRFMLAAAPNEADAHDDYPDSLAIACEMTRVDSAPMGEEADNVFFQRNSVSGSRR